MEEEEVKPYRSRCMRGSYLSLDRPDLLYAVKETSRTMQNPQICDVGKLDRIAKFLVKHRKVVQKFPWQDLPSELLVECDSDHAGCQRTRKSTTGYVGLLGSSTVALRCVSQSILALSSAEAEFYGLCSAAKAALGLCSLLADLGVFVTIKIGMDASAAIAMASRRGLGKAKHMHVQYLWIQELIQSRTIILEKLGTEDNRSDLMTKHLQAPRMKTLMSKLGFYYV